mmetsp:Transcript_32158/g.88180  ORF Transcript_32158/g.88180 Transcript_32158/m.88180 type:complete len:150 (-) Transcript_32158:491-940(-)
MSSEGNNCLLCALTWSNAPKGKEAPINFSDLRTELVASALHMADTGATMGGLTIAEWLQNDNWDSVDHWASAYLEGAMSDQLVLFLWVRVVTAQNSCEASRAEPLLLIARRFMIICAGLALCQALAVPCECHLCTWTVRWRSKSVSHAG